MNYENEYKNIEEQIINNNKKEKEKERLFYFSKINKYYLLPFLCPVFCMLCNINVDIIIKTKEENIMILLRIIQCLSYLLAGLLTFIPSLREKNKNSKNDAIMYKQKKRSTSMELVLKKDYIANKGKSKMAFFNLFLISLCIVINQYLVLFSKAKHIIEIRIYIFLFLIIFSKFILKQNIYKHHIISLSISFIGFFFIIIFTLLKFEKSDIIGNIYYFISYIGFSLYIVLIKYLTENYFISPFDCLLYIGIGTLILSIIYNIIYSEINYNDLRIITNIFNFSNQMIFLYLFFLLILLIIYFVLTVLIIYYFSPILLMVADIISPMLYFIYDINYNNERIEEPKLLNIIFHYIGYFIILICSLIYNEIIICNFCDLNRDTHKYIIKRQKQELALLKNEENNNEINKSENEEE